MSKKLRILPALCLLPALAVFAYSTPAQAKKCVKIHPIFGVKTYVDEKYCPPKAKKPARPKAAKARSKPRVRARTTQATSALRVARPAPRGDAQVKALQTRLTAMGYDAGPADGLMGPNTRKAARSFNQAVGLPEDAPVADTLKVLKRISGK